MAIYIGTQKIDVSGVDKVYVGTQLVYQQVVPKVLTSITLSGQTTSITRGSSYSFGGTVTAHYDDSSTANVTSSTTFSGYNMSTAGTYTVTASYTEDGVTKTATYSLNVTAKWTVSFAKSWMKTSHVNGDAFTRADADISGNSSTSDVDSLYMAYKVNNSGTAPAIWTSDAYQTSFTTKTYGVKTRFCFIIPGGAPGSYSGSTATSAQDATVTLPASGTTGYTLISNTKLGRASSNNRYGYSRRVIFEYSGNKTIKITNNSTKPSYWTSSYTISLV